MMLQLTLENVLTTACGIFARIILCSWWAYGIGHATGKMEGYEIGREQPKDRSDDAVLELLDWRR
jgi:hypothetical protein